MILMVTVMTCVMMMIMTRAPTTMIRMKTMTMTITTSKKIVQSGSMYCIWHMLCEGGEGEGCEDCSDQRAAGEAVPGVLQHCHTAQVHILFGPDP